MSQPLLTESPEKTKQRIERRESRPDSARSFQSGPSPILQLQRTLGNQCVAQLIKAKRLTPDGKIIGLQPKFTVGAADDQYEQEADRIARQVVSMPDPAAMPAVEQGSQVEGGAGQGHILQSKPLPLAASITPFVQRQTAIEEGKGEDKDRKENEEELLQAKFFDKSLTLPLQRELSLEKEEQEPIRASALIRRDISPEEDQEQSLQTKLLSAPITLPAQQQAENNEEPQDEETTPAQAKLLPEINSLPLQCQTIAEEETEPMRAQSAASLSGSFEAGDDAESRLGQSKGQGSPLPDHVRSYMEPRFGVDFSHVRVHTGSNAIQMNRDVGAQAFTHGSDIYYGAGCSPCNLELTAHELTHVVQQMAESPLRAKQANVASSADSPSSIQKIYASFSADKSAIKEPNPSSVHRAESDQAHDELKRNGSALSSSSTAVASSARELAFTEAVASTPQQTRSPFEGNAATVATPSSPSPAAPLSPATSVTPPSRTDNLQPAANRLSSPTNRVATPSEVAPGQASTNRETISPLTHGNNSSRSQTSPAIGSPQRGLSAPVRTQPMSVRANSPEYLALVQEIATQQALLIANAEQEKAQITSAAEQEKQATQRRIEAEALRVEGSYDNVVARIQSAGKAHRTSIYNGLQTERRKVMLTADAEIARLNDVITTKKTAVLQKGDEKAERANQCGEKEAQRAQQGSIERGQRAEQVGNEKVAQYRSSENGAAISDNIRSEVPKLVAKFFHTGNEVASSVRHKAAEIAGRFREEASEIVGKFDEPLEDAHNQILENRNKTLEILQEIADQAAAEIDNETSNIGATLAADKADKTTQVREPLPDINASLDEGAADAVVKIDAQTLGIAEELNIFAEKIREGAWYPPFVQDARADLLASLSEQQKEQQNFVGQMTNSFAQAGASVQDEVAEHSGLITNAVEQLGNDFLENISKVATETTAEMQEASGKGEESMKAITPEVEKKLQEAVDKCDAEWEKQLTEMFLCSVIPEQVDAALAEEDRALDQFTADLDSRARRADNPGILESIWDFVVGVFEGLLIAAWETLKAVWEAIKTPLFWIFVAVVVVILVIAVVVLVIKGAAVLAAIAAVLAFAGKVLLVIGVIAGLIAAGYYVYLMITQPNLSSRERGRLFGRAILEVIMALVGTGILKRLGVFAQLGRLSQFVERVGGIGKALRLINLLPDLDTLILLLDKVGDADRLIVLLDKIGDAEKLILLLDKVGDGEKLIQLLDRVGDAEKLIRLLDRVQDVAQLERLLGHAKLADLAQLERLLGNARLIDAAQLERLLSEAKLTDAVQLERVLNDVKLADAVQLERLLGDAKLADAGQLERLLGDAKLADAAQLERLLGNTKITDAVELERLLIVTDDAAQLERFLAQVDNAVDLERLINNAGLTPPPSPDAFRLERVLIQMGPGSHSTAAIETALDAQKRIDNKILQGEPKALPPLGMPPSGVARELRGGHSPRILTDPDYQILLQTSNADGTIEARFQKLLYSGPPPVFSKTKVSTLAPPSWSDNAILVAGDTVAKTPPVSVAPDGRTLHLDYVNGIQWAVIKDGSGAVTSSFPTGGKPVPF